MELANKDGGRFILPDGEITGAFGTEAFGLARIWRLEATVPKAIGLRKQVDLRRLMYLHWPRWVGVGLPFRFLLMAVLAQDRQFR